MVYPIVNVEAMYRRRSIGQDEIVEGYAIDRPLADAAKLALAKLVEASQTRPDLSVQPCWRDLRIVRWRETSVLRAKLVAFLESTAETIKITPDEYAVLDKILTCADQVLRSESEQLERTLRTVGAAIGIVGGIITIGALIF